MANSRAVTLVRLRAASRLLGWGSFRPAASMTPAVPSKTELSLMLEELRSQYEGTAFFASINRKSVFAGGPLFQGDDISAGSIDTFASTGFWEQQWAARLNVDYVTLAAGHKLKALNEKELLSNQIASCKALLIKPTSRRSLDLLKELPDTGWEEKVAHDSSRLFLHKFGVHLNAFVPLVVSIIACEPLRLRIGGINFFSTPEYPSNYIPHLSEKRANLRVDEQSMTYMYTRDSILRSFRHHNPFWNRNLVRVLTTGTPYALDDDVFSALQGGDDEYARVLARVVGQLPS